MFNEEQQKKDETQLNEIRKPFGDQPEKWREDGSCQSRTLAGRLVGTVQLRAVYRYFQEKQEELMEIFDDKSDSLLQRISELELKLTDGLEHVQALKPFDDKREEHVQSRVEEIVQTLTAEHKASLERIVDTYQRQIKNLERDHAITVQELTSKLSEHCCEQQQNEVETASVNGDFSQTESELLDSSQQLLDETQQLEVEERVDSEEKQLLLKELQQVKQVMASLVKEKEAIAKQYREEGEKLKQKHQKHVQQIKSDFSSQLQAAASFAEHRHLEDSQTLKLLHSHLQQVQQERDTLQTALLSLHSSVTALLPAAPPIKSSLVTPTASVPADMVTPTSHTRKPPNTVSTGDSGLDSQQTSAGRAPPTFSNLANNGSVLRSLRPARETTPISNEAESNPDLSISQLHEEEEATGMDNLTIFSLNSSSGGEQLVELTTPISHSIEGMVSQLYRSVSQLLDNFLLSSTQASQYQCELSQAQEELVRSQTDLTNQLKIVEQLQNKVHLLQNELAVQETKDKDMISAQEKIASLISEVEQLRENSNMRELVKETEQLLENHHQLEETHDRLKTQQQNQLKALEDERRGLTEQVLSLEKDLLLSQKEGTAQRKCIQDMQEKMERNQVQYRKEVESLKANEKRLIGLTKERDSRIHELEDLPNQLTAARKIQDNLQETVKELNSQLTAALHRAALAESATDLQQQLDSCRQQYQRQQERYDNLLKTYEENVASLTFASEELDHEKASKLSLERKVEEYKREFDSKMTEIEQLRTVKDEAQEQCSQLNQQINILTSQVDTLTNGLKTSSEQVSKLCTGLEEKEALLESMTQAQVTQEEQIEELQSDSEHHLKAFEQSVLQVQQLQDELDTIKQSLATKEKALNSLSADKEAEVTALKKQLNEKEDFYQLQVQSLHTAVEQIKSELSCKEQDIRLRHELELKELEERLQAEYTGQQALLRLQLKELSSSVDSQLLQQLADLAPTLEQDAHQVLKLCQKNSSETEQLQQASNEVIKSLNDTNESLRHDISLAEDSMQLANVTLATLKAELEQSRTRERALQQQLVSQSTEAAKMLNGTQKQFEALLANEQGETRNQLSEMTRKYQQLTQEYQSVVKSSQSREKEWQENYSLLEEELKVAHYQGVQSNLALEENMKLVEKMLAELEAIKSNHTHLRHSKQVEILKEALEAKENELSQTINNYLEEKLKVAQLRGENSSLQTSLNSPTKATSQKLDYDLSERFDQEKGHLQMTLKSTKAKCHRLTSAVRKMDRRCKALVFQKRYLSSELDAYYHTHQAALLMIQDMGGLPWQPRVRPAAGSQRKFRRIGLMVLAAVRWRMLPSRRQACRTKSVHIPLVHQVLKH